MGTGGSWTNPKLYSGQARPAGSQRTGKRPGGVMCSVYKEIRRTVAALEAAGTTISKADIRKRVQVAEIAYARKSSNQRPRDTAPDRHPLLDKGPKGSYVWGTVFVPRICALPLYQATAGHPVERVPVVLPYRKPWTGCPGQIKARKELEFLKRIKQEGPRVWKRRRPPIG